MLFISNRVISLFEKANLFHLIDKMQEISKEKECGFDHVDFSYDDMTKISFITNEKYERFLKDNNINLNEDSTSFIFERLHSQSIRNRYGTKTKIGRFLRKFFTEKEVSTKDIESLIALASEKCYSVEVVDGSAISHYYFEENNLYNEGTLGHSCMRYDDCQTFFGVYEENAKMAILKKDGKGDEIVGRAILWDNVILSDDDGSERIIKLMDRMYTASTEQEVIFSNWAIKNGYFFKTRQDFGTFTITSKDEIINIEGRARIEIGRLFNTYPYMDTFSGLTHDGTLWAMASKDRDTSSGEFYENKMGLRNTNGNIRVKCSSCGNEWTYHETIDYTDNYHEPEDMMDGIDYVCPKCLKSDFIYIEDVGHRLKRYFDDKVTKCDFTNSIRLKETLMPFMFLDKDRNIVNGHMFKPYAESEYMSSLPVVSNGVALDLRLVECDICGKQHDGTGNHIVDVYGKEETYHRGSPVFNQLSVCTECFIEGIANHDFISFDDMPKSDFVTNEHYMSNLIDGRSSATRRLFNNGKMEFFKADSIKGKCIYCGEEYHVLESVSADSEVYWKLKSIVMDLCPCCANKYSKEYVRVMGLCGDEFKNGMKAFFDRELENKHFMNLLSENYILKYFSTDTLVRFAKDEGYISLSDLLRDSEKVSRLSIGRNNNEAMALCLYKQLIAFCSKPKNGVNKNELMDAYHYEDKIIEIMSKMNNARPIYRDGFIKHEGVFSRGDGKYAKDIIEVYSDSEHGLSQLVTPFDMPIIPYMDNSWEVLG
ncbi:MAG: hypothetical protein ACRDCW_02600 [Sarcina sp.]